MNTIENVDKMFQSGTRFTFTMEGDHKPDEEEIVAATKKVVEEDGNIGAVLLECTELPPAAHAVQNAVRLPVWDYTTLTKWIHDGCLRRKFTGLV